MYSSAYNFSCQVFGVEFFVSTFRRIEFLSYLRVGLIGRSPAKIAIFKKTGQTYRPTDRQTDENFFCLFCVLRHKKYEHSSKGENFFYSCDYNTFSFYILRM